MEKRACGGGRTVPAKLSHPLCKESAGRNWTRPLKRVTIAAWGAKARRVQHKGWDRHMQSGGVESAIVTPVRAPGFFSRLAGGQYLPGFAARLGAALARRMGTPFRFGGTVIAARHDQVCELLSRDLDFGIAPVNAAKIDEVNGGRFVLGMDRSAALERDRRGLYDALAAVDLAPLRRAVAEEAAAAVAAVPAGGEIDAVGGYARPIATRTAQRLFGLTDIDERAVMEAARSIFAHTFLNLGNDTKVRDRAVRAGAHMQRWFAEEIARRRAAGAFGTDMMGQLLRAGLLDDEGARRTLGGMFVGSIDTTASCVAKILTVAGRDRTLLDAMRRDADDTARLYGWCNEALRRWPHNPIVIRSALTDSQLGGRDVKAGDRVVAWTQAAMLDRETFDDPHRLRPDRDGRAYLHLGGGVHPCAGRPVNAFQIPLLVGALVKRGVGRVGTVGWAGPFPHRLPVCLSEAPQP